MYNKASLFYEKYEYWIKAVFAVLCFSLFFSWAYMQPFNSCPDEGMRFDMPKYILNNWSLPNANDKSIVNEAYGFSYASNPMLPYMISAVFMKVASLFSTSEFVLLMAARMTSIFAGLGYVIVIMKLSKYVCKSVSIQWLFIVLCSLWPQMDFVFTYVNCDGLAMFSVAVIIYNWFSGFNNGWNLKNSIGLAVGLSIGLLTYLNVYIFAPLSVFLFLLYFIFCDTSEHKRKSFFKYGFIILGIVLALTGWHFIRNMVLYNGNIFAQNVNNYGELYAWEGFKPSERSALAHEMLSTLGGNISWMNSTLVSLIGNFGFMSIMLYMPVYAIYAAEVLVAAAGIICVIIKNRFRVFNRKYILSYTLILAIILAFVMSYIYSFRDYQPQGRYVLPALIPICCFMTWGISRLFKKHKAIVSAVIILANTGCIISCLYLISVSY